MRTGRPPKPPGRAQGHRQHPGMALVPATEVEVRFHPAPPPGLSPEGVQDWDDFWETGFVEPVNWHYFKRPFCRLWRLYDEERRFEALAKDNEVTTGSQGQPVLNPAVRALDATRARILELEVQFGQTTTAAMRFGLQVGALRKSMDDRIREANERARQIAPPARKTSRR